MRQKAENERNELTFEEENGIFPPCLSQTTQFAAKQQDSS